MPAGGRDPQEATSYSWMMPPRMSRRLVAPSPIGVTGRGIGWERSSDRDQRAARRARDSSRRRGDGRPGGAALLAGAGAPISLRPWTGCRSDVPGHPRAHDVPGGRGRRATRWGAWPCSPSRVKPGVELLDFRLVSLHPGTGATSSPWSSTCSPHSVASSSQPNFGAESRSLSAAEISELPLAWENAAS